MRLYVGGSHRVRRARHATRGACTHLAALLHLISVATASVVADVVALRGTVLDGVPMKVDTGSGASRSVATISVLTATPTMAGVVGMHRVAAYNDVLATEWGSGKTGENWPAG